MDYILDSGILYFVIAFFIIRHLWKIYINPAAVLGRQAANMNWVVSGRVEDSDGYKNVRYVRDNMEAVVSFQNGNVILTKPNHLEPFKDFIEIERYIATRDNEEEYAGEVFSFYEDYVSEILDKSPTKKSVLNNTSSETIQTDFDRMTFTESIKTCFSKYATFSGRASRSEYWWFYLFLTLIEITVVTFRIEYNLMSIILSYTLLLPTLAVTVRRLHDTNKSGWWFPALFVLFVLFATGVEIVGIGSVLLGGFITAFYLLYLLIQAGDKGENQYGENPLKGVCK